MNKEVADITSVPRKRPRLRHPREDLVVNTFLDQEGRRIVMIRGVRYVPRFICSTKQLRTGMPPFVSTVVVPETLKDEDKPHLVSRTVYLPALGDILKLPWPPERESEKEPGAG